MITDPRAARGVLLTLALAVACAAPEPVAPPSSPDSSGHVQNDMSEKTGSIAQEPSDRPSSPAESVPGDSNSPAPSDDAPSPAPSAPALAVVDRPIRYDEARVTRTIAYRQAHQDPQADGVEIDPRMIILHHTGGGSADATWRYFDRPTIESGRKAIADAGDLNVSAHFLVDRDGTIFRLMPETSMARHCIGLNHVAIGVENVGDLKEYPLTDAQVEADAALVRDLKARFPAITHLIGHHEYLAMEAHPYFVERDPKYRTRKGDPGPEFMARVRARVADLGLEGPPVP